MHVIGITDKGMLGDSKLTPATLGVVRNLRVFAFVAADLKDVRIRRDRRFNCRLALLKALSTVLLLSCVVLTHCDEIRQQAQPANKPRTSSDTKPHFPLELKVNLDQIEVSDLQVVPSATHALTGDLRQFYVVSGRIENRTGKQLRSVTIRIYAETSGSPLQRSPKYNKDWEGLDQADVHIDGPINDDWPKGFSQQIQLLVPKGKPWTFEAGVIEAEPDSNVE